MSEKDNFTPLRVGSLFSGIGGLDLGLERAGMSVKWQSEIEPYGCRVLAKHWPDVPNLGDIKQIEWSEVENVDLICGGYPCQPFSTAGSRKGKDDPRHLWPYFADALRVLRPQWALLENVSGHLSLGFGDVLADLASLGYDAEWESLPAAAFGAPQRRFRVFIVAYLHSGRRRGSQKWDGEGTETFGRIDPDGLVMAQHRAQEATSRVLRVDDGLPKRVDRVRGLGNAVVPQVAEYLGRCIMEAA